MSENNNEYESLAQALDRLPNGFPSTASNVEIALLKKIFGPAEAYLAGQLKGEMEPIESIAERAGLSAKDAQRRLLQMAKRGLVWFDKRDGKSHFRLAPFIVGIYEAQLDSMDHELAHLFEQYMLEGGAKGIMQYEPALQRIVPAASLAKSEWILPYDDIKAIIRANKRFWVRNCICRVQQANIGHKCDLPLNMCLSLSPVDNPGRPGNLSEDEALGLLDQAEELGLVHSVSNIQTGVNYICNCCGCCCAILRGITQWGIAESVAQANYFATIDSAECSNCGTCIGRCQVKAIAETDGISVVDKKKCIGCGLCVTGCPTGAARIQRKPDTEIIMPPVNYDEWEHRRSHSRGLIG